MTINCCRWRRLVFLLWMLFYYNFQLAPCCLHMLTVTDGFACVVPMPLSLPSVGTNFSPFEWGRSTPQSATATNLYFCSRFQESALKYFRKTQMKHVLEKHWIVRNNLHYWRSCWIRYHLFWNVAPSYAPSREVIPAGLCEIFKDKVDGTGIVLPPSQSQYSSRL